MRSIVIISGLTMRSWIPLKNGWDIPRALDR